MTQSSKSHMGTYNDTHTSSVISPEQSPIETATGNLQGNKVLSDTHGFTLMPQNTSTRKYPKPTPYE